MIRTIEILGQEFTVYRQKGDDTDLVREDCWKCNGAKYLAHFYHVHNGECFACRATGGQYFTVEQMTKRIKGRQQRAAAKVRKAAREQARLEAQLARFAEVEPELAFMATDAVHDDEIEMHPILRDMGRRLQAKGEISAKQIAFAHRLIAEAQQKQARREAEKAMAKPAPLGRHTVNGLVIKVVDQETDYGLNWRVTIKTDDGWVANGNLPQSIRSEYPFGGEFADLGEWIKGRRIELVATLERPKGKDDPTFVFFSRPTKGQLVQEEVVTLD